MDMSVHYPETNFTASAGAGTKSFRSLARESDTETVLNYYRARYYDPSASRFISEDPAGLDGGINFYAYANNNPICKETEWVTEVE